MMLQIAIAVFGGLAIFLTQQKHEELKRFACIFGLLSQPLFLIETFTNGQWGMFGLALFYTWAWWLGFYYQWLQPASAGDNNNEIQQRTL